MCAQASLQDGPTRKESKRSQPTAQLETRPAAPAVASPGGRAQDRDSKKPEREVVPKADGGERSHRPVEQGLRHSSGKGRGEGGSHQEPLTATRGPDPTRRPAEEGSQRSLGRGRGEDDKVLRGSSPRPSERQKAKGSELSGPSDPSRGGSRGEGLRRSPGRVRTREGSPHGGHPEKVEHGGRAAEGGERRSPKRLRVEAEAEGSRGKNVPARVDPR